MNAHTTLASAFSRLRNGLDKTAASLEQDEAYTLKAARSDIAHYIACCVAEGEEHKVNVNLAVVFAQEAKGKSRTALVKACDSVVRELDSLIAAQRDKSDELEAVKVPSVTPEQAFVNRCVHALDKADYGTHNVYVHFFRISYGVWMDAVEVVNAGSLADYLESLGMSPADTAELMAQDWDCQDAEGLALKCLGNWGSFDWKLMGELLEAAEQCEVDVLEAGLAIGIPANEVAEKHQGEWDNAEDYAYDYWESCGLLAEVPESARNYLNWEAIARDMLLNGDVVESNKHYFHTC